MNTHLRPNRLVMMWGRRDTPTGSLNEHEWTPFLWNPTDPTDPTDPTIAKTVSTPQPTLANATKVNLSCGGHAFLPDDGLRSVGSDLPHGSGVNPPRVGVFVTG